MNDEQLVQIFPSQRQLEHQKLEFYAFVHFTVNTFTGKEWGDGTESPLIFQPNKLDAEQWVKAVKSAGMKGLILTCKHHDGFCLWPSRYTDHTVASSPYKNGKGDIVREVADACRKHSIKFGVYLSPWDRNSRLYGQGKAYDDFFVNQLTELLTNYGEIFSVWFDGACGEGPNGKRQVYDWERYYSVIRSLQPMACISVCGPDVRWCGNEAGYTRKAEWSVVPKRAMNSEIIAEKSQQTDSNAFRERRVDARDEDLGSREILANERELIWYPAEVNTSIRPGWFYHEEEDDKVKTLEKLMHVYIHSVGGNATFLLNIPPTKEGLFHANDVRRLAEVGDCIRTMFETNLIDRALSVEKRNDDTEIEICWKENVSIGAVVLMEDITKSQRVESFYIEAFTDGAFRKIYENTVIGYKRIAIIDGLVTNKLRVVISDCRQKPFLSDIGIYEHKGGSRQC